MDERNIFAVVRVSRNPKKYGHQVYRGLKEAGYEVYPVNPNAEEALGDKFYSSLEYLPAKPDVVDFVVPSRVKEKIVKTCRRLGIAKMWMQLGSESESSIKFCIGNDIDVVHAACVMIERRSRA